MRRIFSALLLIAAMTGTAHAATAAEAARSLRAIVDGGKGVAANCKRLSAQEEEADAISYEVMQAIRRSFITPFDRSDIKALSVALDDAIDQMNKTAKTVMLYDVTKFTPNMKAMADKIIVMSDLIVEGLPLMRRVGAHSARLHTLTGELTRLEGESDTLNEEGFLSFALDPNFASNRHVWTYYSMANPRRTVLVRSPWRSAARNSSVATAGSPAPWK